MNGFMAPCIYGAAAELDMFTPLADSPMTARQVAETLQTDDRATAMLLDALAAIKLLEKKEGVYSVPEALTPWLSEKSPGNVLPMIRHRMNTLRGWAQLAWTAKAGFPAPRTASIRGVAADQASFIAAMHTVSGPMADDLVSRLGPPPFKHLLDVGGASGTWTLAFLQAVPEAQATIFDLAPAIEQAKARLVGSGLADRVALVAGDFYVDDLPHGADFVWVSAIIHQHSRQHNRDLFAKVFAALEPGGTVGIRDVVMEPCRTRPVDGALFAINMLANTQTGGTFTFEEIAEDLRAAGFAGPELRIKDERMSSVVLARKPPPG
jgi:hypothetical protein